MSDGINRTKNRRFEDEGSGFGERHVQMLLLFFGLMVAFGMRVNLSVAIVAMTELPEYNWSEKIKSLVLSSFFWGYVITQVPAGILARKFGAKVTIMTGLTVCSLLNVLTPLCAKLGGWKLLFAVRVLEGICQGVLYPSYHTLISAWVPPKERASLGTYAYVGASFGTIVMLASSGVLASMAGWASIFYISGGSGCLWVVAYFQRGASSPTASKSISEEERSFIELEQTNEAGKTEKPAESLPTPWLSFFTSPPFLALIAAHCASTWGFWTLLTQIPNYMKNVLGKDIKANALLSSLPYTVMLLLSFVFVWLSKILQKKDSLSMSFNRKLFNSIGHFTPMVLLIALGYVAPGQDVLAVSLLSLTVGISAAAQLGFMINHIDLSPNFAGVLMGISNGIANVMSIIGPLLVGIIVSDNKDASQWRIVFFIAAGFYLVGNGLFVIFGKASIQSWNNPTANSEYSSTPQLETPEKTSEA
ncbi:putative inorganic phosphate cotransporter [Drosophila sulfurigaster albostrigata]|uniref:putative inorganic phosphate cotransporter n=1 Tax=Drosophila sulfurigaster albostrigata TaxID=89887 RepID=UPI002D21936B|nr:putative inorganic phosphate cotransporter [Drosophila sulfurigaster albostrigata]